MSVLAQISPGKLAQPHSHLEGLNNCTQCHDLGNAVTQQKCLSCHTSLKSRVDAKKGFHASKEVTQKNCISCHSEHHGQKFEMIRFDQKKFDHNVTGFQLNGKHKTVDCRECHKPDHIANAELRKNTKTYLGLDLKCVSCHEDVHQKTLSQDCASCHNEEAFKPAVKFQHQKSKFPLLGKHQNVECVACHKVETRNGKSFQHFADLTFANCNACHKDAHAGRFGKNCKACHSEESFAKIKSNPSFNHSTTGYELQGKHKHLDCKSCHDQRNQPAKSYQEFVKINPIECITCHRDVHDGKFGKDCKSCHNQESFRVSKNLENFDHEKTNFPLVGRHQSVDCKSCHKGKMTDPVAHENCIDCHTDFHRGEFSTNLNYKDCKACHNEQGFRPSNYTLEQHMTSVFPLKGSHLAVSCDACHKKNNASNWSFKNIGKQCQDCHTDIHKTFLDEKFYLGSSCANCHKEEAWSEISFDHDVQTKFKLELSHKKIDCRACHFDEQSAGSYIQNFKNKSQDCAFCHQSSHGNQFEIMTKTDCNRCHKSSKWQDLKFSHDSTRFPLKGEHKLVSCNQCHIPENREGKPVIWYRNGKLECKDCHQ